MNTFLPLCAGAWWWTRNKHNNDIFNSRLFISNTAVYEKGAICDIIAISE
jgi:hypothetical protein